MKKKAMGAALLICAALILGGCGAAREDTPAEVPAPTLSASAVPQGVVAEKKQALMAPYEAELKLTEAQYPDCLTYRIPDDVLSQMAQDAEAVGAAAEEGRLRFSRRQNGEYAYESTAEEALTLTGEGIAVTPDPADETPMDSQLNGDYAVSGGGLFERLRVYDAEEDLKSGSAEFSDALNGRQTGYELFRFCVREGALYFADAALDVASGMDGLTVGESYLAVVGVLRADGLDIVEYRLNDLEALPDPAELDWQRFVSSVTPLSRLTAQKDTVRLTAP